MTDASKRQAIYYGATAEKYDDMHVGAGDEHSFALSFLLGMLDYFEIRSILDVGSGTGRALSFVKQRRPDIRLVGVEPVEALRRVGYSKGLTRDELISGDGTRLDFDEGEFDLVCEFGVLHHVARPGVVVREMLRVAGKAVFLSDNNIYGDPSPVTRRVKQLVQALGLWKTAILAKTRGKGYTDTDSDGIAYYYSVFDSFDLIRSASSSVHYVNTNPWTGVGRDLYRTASHVAMLARLDKPLARPR
jgi:SAM-dependent methyltransferase